MSNGTSRPRDAYYEEINKRAASYDPLNAAFPGRTIEEIASYNERVTAATQDRKFTEPVRRETGLPLGLGLMTVPASVAHTLVKPVVELARQWPKQIELAKRGVYDLGYWAEVAMYGMGGSAPGMRGSQVTASGIMLRGEKKVPLLPPGKPAPMFYSQLEKELMSGKYGKTPKATSLMNRLSKEGVTADELEWTGVGAWLKEQGQQRVEIEDVLRKAQERPLTEQVRFKDLGTTRDAIRMRTELHKQISSARTAEVAAVKESHDYVFSLPSTHKGEGGWSNEALQEATELRSRALNLAQQRHDLEVKLSRLELEGTPTQYGPHHPTWGPHWNLPGTIEEGSYRELLVKFPGEQAGLKSIESFGLDELVALAQQAYDGHIELSVRSSHVLQEFIKNRQQNPNAQFLHTRNSGKQSMEELTNALNPQASPQFESGHYERGGEGKNLMGWVRGHVRKAYISAKEGWKRVWLIDEAQFDWQKRGAEHGYRKGPERITRITELPPGVYVENVGPDFHYVLNRNGQQIGNAEATPAAAIRTALEQLNEEASRVAKGEIANVPYKKDWYKLAIRRVMREAAEQDVDGVSWTTAVTQAQRTNRFASAMEWFKSDKGNYEVTFTAPNGEKIVRRYYDLDEVTKEAGQNVSRLIKTQEQEWISKHGEVSKSTKHANDFKASWKELEDQGFSAQEANDGAWYIYNPLGDRIVTATRRDTAIQRTVDMESVLDLETELSNITKRPQGNAQGDFLVKAQFYEMLYDKQFVKFMREEFGALPEKVKTETKVGPKGESVDVWYIPLTQELKSRILYEGQRISQLKALEGLKSAYG